MQSSIGCSAGREAWFEISGSFCMNFEKLIIIRRIVEKYRYVCNIFATTLQMYTHFFNMQIFFALFFEKIENNFLFNSILLAYKVLKIRKTFAFLLQNCNFSCYRFCNTDIQ